MFDILLRSELWIGVIVAAMGLVFWLYARGLTRRSARLRVMGRDGEGRVTGIAARTRSIYFQSGIRFNVPIWVLDLTYADAAGRERVAQLEVSKTFGETLRVDDVIAVRFLVDRPGVMEVEPGRYAQEAGQVYMLAVICFAAAALGFGRLFLWGA